jgi:ATP-dependent protease ClpP protease subunit
VLAFCIGIYRANSAEITINPNGKPTPEVGRIIEITGEITTGDDLRLIAALNNAPPNTLIFLTSPGGLIEPAIAMGRTIRNARANTLVSGTCASACGLIWLAGTKRFTFSNGQIGFHAAYSGENATVNGTANALIGAYVAELGFGENVIRYITEKPPMGMQWLNEREANLLGIDVVSLPEENLQTDLNSKTEKPSVIPDIPESKPIEKSPNSSVKIEKLAIDFVYQIVDGHLSDTKTALSYVGNNYGDQISYYGKRLSLAEVLADKRAYMDRWPVRETRIRSESIEAKCDDVSCLVTGVYDWAVSNPTLKKKSFGSATFGYGFTFDPKVRVVYEEGKVLKRN